MESAGKSLWFWKVLEITAQGPGKSWKNILENYAFFLCTRGNFSLLSSLADGNPLLLNL